MKLLVVQCPRCKQRMKYHTYSTLLSDKKKKCVFCNHTFSVRKQMREEII